MLVHMADHKAAKGGNAFAAVLKTFLAGMTDLLVKDYEAILVAVPGKGCWSALEASEHGIQRVVDVEMYAECLEEEA